MLLASVSASFTSQIANHGVYAVFGLMALDAVFPALSELVMLYAGAVAAGVFPSDGVTLFGSRIGFGAGAFVALALAGTVGYLVGSLVGWAIGRWGGRPLLERHGRWFHLSPARLDRAEAWFGCWGDGINVGNSSIPAAMAASTYAIPLAIVKAISCTAVDPASRMWYPEMEMVFQLGSRSRQ